MKEALGLIETKGLVACIEAADAMCKAANVELIGYENVDSGVEAAKRIGEVVSSRVIARPHNDIEKIAAQHKA